MTLAESPEWMPAGSTCSMMAPTTVCLPSLMQSTSSSVASSRKWSMRIGLPSPMSAASSTLWAMPFLLGVPAHICAVGLYCKAPRAHLRHARAALATAPQRRPKGSLSLTRMLGKMLLQVFNERIQKSFADMPFGHPKNFGAS